VPELPEVEITRRGIEPFVLGKTITGVVVRNPNLRQRIPRTLARILVGQRVKRLERRGKYLLFQCDAGSLIVHLGMSGSLRAIDPGTLPRDHDHVDLVFGATALRLRDPRRFGVVLWKAGDVSGHPLLKKLGVEPLGDRFSPEFLHRATRGRRVGIKLLLMNAQVMVGIGNIYANESLFRAGIHPRARSGSLSLARCERLDRRRGAHTARAGRGGRHVRAVVLQRDLEVVEVVFERALDHAVLHGGGSDPPPVRPVGIANTDDRRFIAVNHALRFLPPG